MMELRQLRHFLAVAETGSFSEAAEQVYVSQSALTRSIQQLESTLGGPLLRRGVRRTVPTAAGEQLLQYARMILQDCTEAAAEVLAIKSGAVGQVTFGFDPLLSFQCLDVALAKLCAQVPGIAVRALQGASADLIAAVEAGTMDFSVTRLTDDEASRATLLCEPLLAVEPVVVGGRRHALARRRSLDARDLIGAMWLVPDDPQSLDLYERFMAGNGIPATRAVRTNSLALIRDQVMGGAFLSIVPELVVRRELRHRQIRRLDVRLPVGTASFRLHLVTRKDAVRPPAVARVIESVSAGLAAERDH